jgi:hypothetical protein
MSCLIYIKPEHTSYRNNQNTTTIYCAVLDKITINFILLQDNSTSLYIDSSSI